MESGTSKRKGETEESSVSETDVEAEGNRQTP